MPRVASMLLDIFVLEASVPVDLIFTRVDPDIGGVIVNENWPIIFPCASV